jgi:hypothetical protein
VSITLSTIGSRTVTITVAASALREAPGGIAVELTLHDGPLHLTLTCDEARSLADEITAQLADRGEVT